VKAAKDGAARRHTGWAPSQPITTPAHGEVLAVPEISTPVPPVKSPVASLKATAETGSIIVSTAPEPKVLPQFVPGLPVTNQSARAPTLAEFAAQSATTPAHGEVLVAPETSAPVPPVKSPVASLEATAETGPMVVSAVLEPNALPPFIPSLPVTNQSARAPTFVEFAASLSVLGNVMLLSGIAGAVLAIAIGAGGARRYITSRRTPAPRCEEDGEMLMPLRGLVFRGGRDRQHGPISG
jgi:hypothetical protein